MRSSARLRRGANRATPQVITVHCKAVWKAPKGKLVRVCLDVDAGVLHRVVFTGDFFWEPSDDVDQLGEVLEAVPAESARIRETIHQFFADHPAELFGAAPEDFAEAVLQALATRS